MSASSCGLGGHVFRRSEAEWIFCMVQDLLELDESDIAKTWYRREDAEGRREAEGPGEELFPQIS